MPPMRKSKNPGRWRRMAARMKISFARLAEISGVPYSTMDGWDAKRHKPASYVRKAVDARIEELRKQKNGNGE